MVIYSMNEAGKPENWAWMGFDKKPAPASSEKTNEGEKPNEVPATTTKGTADSASANKPVTSSTNPETASTETPNPAAPVKSNSIPPKPIRYEAIQLSEISPDFQQNNRPTALPTESERFWSSFFKSLTTAEQVEWMDLLEVLRSNQPPKQRPPASKTQTELIARAEEQRDDFNNKILDRMSSIPHASKKRSQVFGDYSEANKLWQQQISPALTALKESQDITLAQHQAIVDLQHHLDIEALNLVQDKTAVGWTGDSIAWKRSWKRIYQANIGEPTYVKRIQLTGQPQEFRGKAITVYGFVRDIQTRRASSGDSIAGPQADGDAKVPYYILWIQPSDSDVGPYCVYCLNLPADLPRSRDELVEFRQLATINGIFFKNRSYQAADRSVQYCPLILADEFELKPSLNFKLSPAWMAAALALVPILGVGIVWYAVRSTVSRKRLPSKKSQEEIDVFLGDLKNDPSIKTDLEQIQAIAEHEDDIS